MRDRPGLLEVGRGRLAPPLFEERLLLLGGAHLPQLLAAPLPEGDHLVEGGAVLALEPVEHGQPRLDLVEAARADLEPVAVVAQAQGQVLERGDVRRPPLDEGAELRVDGRELLHPLEDLPEASEGGGLVVVQQAVGLAGERRQPARIRLPHLLQAQGGLLPGHERGPLDLGGLELEHLAPTLHLAPVVAQALERRLDLPQAAEGRRQGREILQAREAVQELEVDRGVEQALRLVLAVDDGQPRRQLAEDTDGDQRPVHAGPPLPVRLDLPAEDDVVAVRGQALPFEHGAGAGQLDHRLDHRPLLARADHLARGPIAEEKPEGVDQDRLAGSRFAGQEREARAQLDLEGADQSDVVDS